MTENSHARPSRSAEFRFYEELNDFLPAERRKVAFQQSFCDTPAVRDVIQAIGVPHTAVDLVLVDGQSVDFAHRLAGGERVAVYPVFERFDISPIVHLRPQPLRQTRFILDVHLGRLARYLRMLGFDSAYRSDWEDTQIIQRARAERRIILTRDVGILKQKQVSHGYWVRHAEPGEQLTEVLEAFDLRRQLKPFTRCLDCNGAIRPVPAGTSEGLVDPDILRRFEHFWRCADCGKIYWRGSHYQRMLEAVQCIDEQRERSEAQP
jgi:uncharacterized protein with PIN domain